MSRRSCVCGGGGVRGGGSGGGSGTGPVGTDGSATKDRKALTSSFTASSFSRTRRIMVRPRTTKDNQRQPKTTKDNQL